ncbi:S41 family peptidase [Bacteroides sp.]|uniref:S41 family peptidase n=1 Tax=Bacteroides sp. TaxID=29523 RepID=UPI0026199BBE|nr:S41 family peptidase [Bacteroides sp.]MDD3038228.1 S41 family peptidase [Bacteroides sp.]
MKLFYCLLFLIFVVDVDAQNTQLKKGFLSLDGAHIFSNFVGRFPKMGWHSDCEEIEIDYHTLPGEKASLMIPSTQQGNIVTAQFDLSNRDIVGKKIVFKGKYKYQQAQDAKVDFTIVLDTYLKKFMSQNTSIKCDGEQDWKEFYVEMPLERTDNFHFRISCMSVITLWVTDCQVLVDGQSFDIMTNPTVEADKDTEFIKGSGIAIDITNPYTLKNLEILGKVWGFLKYYHPQVVIGKYNWDFELFRVLPFIASAKDSNERNFLLNKWIDKYGEIQETEDYSIQDSSKYHRFAHLEWLEDLKLFDNVLSEKLIRIKNAKRNSVFNYYLPILKDKEEIEFVRDKPYPDMNWEDQGYRILTLFRLWNALEYAYPYIDYTTNKWSSLLAKYLPEFIETSSELELNHSIKKVLAEINDSHGLIQFSGSSQPMRKPALGLTQAKDGEFVVEFTMQKEVERGSVILAVNDKEVSEIVEEYRSTIPSSNERGLLRNVRNLLLLTPDSLINLTIGYNNTVYQRMIKTSAPNMPFKGRKGFEQYDLQSKNIIYVNAAKVIAEDFDELMKNRMKTAKGLILDLREYPRTNVLSLIGKYLYAEKGAFMWFSMNSKKNPGNYFLDVVMNSEQYQNFDSFKGKIAILVNENTQSFGEICSIVFRGAPQSAIIGTQTAGANGHVGYLYLPRAVKAKYTASGAFYPEWGMNQRTGVKIDIPVQQTIEDIKAGEDVWIRKAIEYIGNAN